MGVRPGILVLGVMSIGVVVATVNADRQPPAPVDPNYANRVSLATSVMQTILKNAREPSSVVWEAARINQAGTVACIEYRAKNGFGGTNREFVVFADNKLSQANSAWNKRCTAAMQDMLVDAQRLLARVQ